MAYLNNIPQSTDVPSASQSDLLNNFSSLNTQFSVDHVPLIAGSDNGYHTQVTFNQVEVDPSLSFPITRLYTKTSTNGTVNNRFNDLYYYESNTSGIMNVVQMTGGGITAGAWASWTSGGGLVQNYNIASITRTALGSYTVTFTRAFTTSTYCTMISPVMSSGGGFAIKVINISKAASNFSFALQNQTNAFSDAVELDIVCFGVLV